MPAVHRIIGTPSSQWELHAWHSGQAAGESWTFSDRTAASSWLMRFKSDPISMAGLRSLALKYGVGSSLQRSGDDQLLEEVSWLLSRGVLQVHRLPPRRTAWRTTDAASSPAVVASSPRPTASQSSSGSAPPRVVEEADTFSAQTDPAATAAVLRSAAASGAPFCEECAKAADARKAA